jgi:hypothetical protein
MPHRTPTLCPDGPRRPVTPPSRTIVAGDDGRRVIVDYLPAPPVVDHRGDRDVITVLVRGASR